MLSNLLRSQRSGSPGPLPLLSLPVVPTTDLLGALSALQQTALKEGPPDLAALRSAQANVRETLLQSFGIGTGPKASARSAAWTRTSWTWCRCCSTSSSTTATCPTP